MSFFKHTKLKKFISLMNAIALALSMVLGLPVISPIEPAAAAEDKIAYWQAEGNASDTVGSNHGTLINDATFAPGRVGQAFSFDGTGDFVDVGTDTVFNFNNGTGDFTLGAWIKPSAMPAYGAGIFGKITHGPDPFTPPFTGWAFYFYSDGALAIGNAGAWEMKSAVGTVKTDEWQYVVATKNGNTYKLYKNGVEVASSTAGDLAVSSTSLRLGSDYDDAFFFSGLIDEAAVYGRALSVSEITQVYEGTPPSVVSVNPANGTVNVPVDSTITAVFSESIDTSTINSSSLYLDNGATGTVSYNPAAKAAVFQPSSDLAYETTYTATVTTAIKDTTGNSLPDNYSWSFKTVSGPVSYWAAESNASDTIGSNHGTLMNGAGFAPGRVGQAFSFDGIDDYAGIANTSSLDFGIQDFTIDMWFKLNSLSGEQMFFQKYEGGLPIDSPTYLVQFFAPNYLRFLVRESATNNNDLQVSTSLVTGRWYHLAAVRNGNTNNLYLDGTLIGSQTAGNNVNTGTGGTTKLGNLVPDVVGDTRYLNGYLDEVRIYDRALSGTEIVKQYNDTPPSVEAVTPVNGATDVPADTTVTAMFSESIDTSTIDNSSFTLNNGATGTVSYNPATRIATFQPSSNLNYDTTYTATITTAVKDSAGNNLPSTYSWSFSTERDLISYWPAEDNASDSVGSNDGTLVGDSTYSAGRVGRAVRFDGSGDFITIPNASTLRPSNITIGSWIKTSATNSGAIFSSFEYPVIGPTDGGVIFGINYTPGDGRIFLDLSDTLGGRVQVLSSVGGLNDNNWHYIVGTYDGSALKVYVDGAERGSLNWSNGIAYYSATNKVRIGARSYSYGDTTDYFFNGVLDEVKIYGRALSAAQITEQYENAPPPDITPPTTDITFTTANGAGWHTTEPTITLTPNETAAVQYQWDSTSSAGWIGDSFFDVFVEVTGTPEGARTLYYRSIDAAENIESAKSREFKIDRIAPTGTMKINNDSTYTTAADVVLSFNAADSTGSGVTQMRFADSTGTLDATSYRSYSATAATSLIGDGIKTMYVKFIDIAGNESTVTISDSIVLDTALPANPSAAEVGGTVSDVWQNPNSDPVFTLSDASGTGSDIARYHIYWGTDPAGVPDTSIPTTTFDPPAAANPSTNYLRVQTEDAAGNKSVIATLFTFKYDGQAPTDPTIASPSHTAGGWSSDGTIDVNLSGATDGSGSGIDGYSYSFTAGPSDVPDAVKDAEEGATSFTSSSLGEGAWYAHLRTRDNAGNWTSTRHIGPFRIDKTAPTATVTSTKISTNESKTKSFNVSWSGADSGGSGIASYDVQVKIGKTGAWTNWKTGTTATSAVYTGAPGKTAYFRARTTDGAGNTGAYSSESKTIVPFDNNSLIKSKVGFGATVSAAKSNYYLGTARYSTKGGDEITYVFTGDSFSLIGNKGPKYSKAEVTIDGVKKTIDAKASAIKFRQVLFTKTWAGIKKHTVKIKNLGTAGRTRFDIDALGVGK